MAKVVIINMELKPRRGDVTRASAALGVSGTAVRQYLAGNRTAIGRDKRERIVIKKNLQKGN